MTKFTKSYDFFWKEIVESIKRNKIAARGDKVVIVSGSLMGVSGKTDTVKVVTI